MIFKEEFSGLN